MQKKRLGSDPFEMVRVVDRERRRKRNKSGKEMR
jgi:hypothetical protein